jgi:uroporphyrinogen decarboxylase
MTPPPKKLLLRALAGERTERPPIWLMRQAGRYLPEYQITRESAGGMLGLCNSPEHAAEVTLQPIRRFQLDAAILFADLPQLPAALGQRLEYREGDGPVLDPPIRSPQDIQRLSLLRLHDELAPIYRTVQILSTSLPSDVTLIGYAGAPWTVATYMVEGRGGNVSEHAIIRRWALSDPDGFQPLIDLLTTAAIEFLKRQIEVGVEAVQLFESCAGILPEPFFQRWCIQPVARIVKTLRLAHPNVPIIAFPRAAGLLYDGYVPKTQVDCVGLDSTVPLRWASEAIQRRLNRCIQGNLDPQMLVVGGEQMAVEVERILRAATQGAFVFNLGHGVLKTTPPDHAAALVRQVQAWRS